jgi:hypothetical protein
LLVVSVLTINLLDLSFAQGKLMSAVLLSFIPVSVALTWSVVRDRFGVPVAVLGVLLGLGCAWLYSLARNSTPDSLAAAFSMSLLLSGVGATILACRVAVRNVGTYEISWRKAPAIGALAVLILVVAVVVGRAERIPVMISRQPIVETAIEGSPELRSCLEWVRVNTPTDSIIATDVFDPEQSSGGGKSHLVSLLTKRRLLLDGLYTKFAEQELINQRKLRAEALTETSIPVDYFVISSEFASSSVTSGLTVVLANSTCVVLRTELR